MSSINCIIKTTREGVASICLYLEERGDGPKVPAAGLKQLLSLHVFGPHPKGEALGEEIRDYIDGKKTVFSDYPLIWKGITPFQKRVLSCLKSVPYGKTISYQALAKRINCPLGVRAVGQVLGMNPWPVLFPCHRVIRKNGELGGFSSGVAIKRILLEIEGGKWR